jgi:hypothetical protein
MADRSAPVLLVSTPIEEALRRLEADAAGLVEWEGERAPGVIAIRRCVSTIREGMKAAEELWATVTETARVTGWSEPTLTKYAAALANGEAVPHEWSTMEARMAGAGGYLIRPSTVPPKPPTRRKAG